MTRQSHSQAYTLRKPKLKETHIPLFIAALITIARKWKQSRCPSIDEWIKKMWYIYTVEYYSAIERNIFGSVLKRWINLEPIIQSEVSQKQKYRILMHVYGIQKDGTENLLAGQPWRCRPREQTYGHGDGDGGEGGTNGEQNGDIFTNICEIDSQGEFAV